MTDMPPPDEPPLRGGRGRSPWPWVWGALGGAAVIALAVVLVIVLVPENHNRLVSGPIGSLSPSRTMSPTPSESPSPSPRVSPAPSGSLAPTSPPASAAAPAGSPTGPAPVDLNLSPTDPNAALKQQIAARWAAYEWAGEGLYLSFSGDMSEFASTATGELESAIIDDAAKFHDKGEYQVGRSAFRDVKVDIANATTATVTACIDSSGTAVYKAITTTPNPVSGELTVTASQLVQKVSGPASGYVSHTTMTLIDGRWMATADSADANC